MIEKGTYTARAVQWDWGTTKDGKEQVAVQMEIVEGQFQGWCITWYGYFTDKTKQRTIESLKYMGWRGDDIMTMTGMGDLLCQIVVDHEQQTEGKRAGEWVAKVRWVNRLGGGGPIKLDRPMDMAAKRMFAAKLKMHARQVPDVVGGCKVENRAPTQKEPQDEAPRNAREDEDIPF